jgi:hypothetical protein
MSRRAATWLVAAATGCGATSPASAPAGAAIGVGPPEVAWSELTRAQQADFMGRVVLPRFATMFQAFDAHAFDKVQCVTCHGPGAEDRTFKMPNPALYVLPETQQDFDRLFRTKRRWMRLMQQVDRDMELTLGLKPFDPATASPGWSGCYSCHTHRPGGQAE